MGDKRVGRKEQGREKLKYEGNTLKKTRSEKHNDGEDSQAAGKIDNVNDVGEEVEHVNHKKKKKEQKYMDTKGDRVRGEHLCNNMMDEVESSKTERKKRKKTHIVDLKDASPDIMSNSLADKSTVIKNGGCADSTKSSVGDGKLEFNAVNEKIGNQDEKSRKKRKKHSDGDKAGDGKLAVDALDERFGNQDGKKRKKRKRDIDFDKAEDENLPVNGLNVNFGNKGGKRRKKQKRDNDGDVAALEARTNLKEVRSKGEDLDENIMKKVEHAVRERKKDRKKRHNVREENEGEVDAAQTEAGPSKAKDHGVGGLGKTKIKKKKKAMSVDNGSEGKGSTGASIRKNSVGITDCTEQSTPKGSSKRVSFSEDVEVFPSSDDPSDEKIVQEDGLVRGKRFSHEENELVRKAVLDYIEAHGLGEKGLEMVMHCREHPELRGCWKEIGSALPWRPWVSVYYRAHILFENTSSSWTPEDIHMVQSYYEKHGPDWKTLAVELGKHRFNVKDAWRRTKFKKEKKGKWSQEEYQSLFDLVNVDLRMKAFTERKSKHGMLRDNIPWTAISEKLETRTSSVCCEKWYNQLTSPMVAEGNWLDVDDYELLIELYELDACCMEDVDWDNLLEHRSGDLCRKRWNQMVKHIGDHRKKSFPEQVEVLTERYCPDVLEAREAYYNKPVVD